MAFLVPVLAFTCIAGCGGGDSAQSGATKVTGSSQRAEPASRKRWGEPVNKKGVDVTVDDPAPPVVSDASTSALAPTVSPVLASADPASAAASSAAPAHGGILVDTANLPVAQPGVSVPMLTVEAVPPVPAPGDWETGGAFRLLCNWAKMSYDDPIVYPGSPGMAHHHTFFGNTAIDAFTTPENIRSKGNASCRGGTINLSGYWVPSVVDTATHKPVAPLYLIIYYKTGFWPYMPDGSVIQPVPAGLRMIAGNSKATTPAESLGGFECFNPATGVSRQGTAGSSIPAACQPGEVMRVRIGFPQCWDGVNLDSPDHKSHMAAPEQHWFGIPERQWRCPPTHPVVLPQITFTVDYPIPASGDLSKWKLSSDMYDGPGGYSFHGDWMNGWDKTISDTWGVKCMRERRECGSADLGDGRLTAEFQGN